MIGTVVLVAWLTVVAWALHAVTVGVIDACFTMFRGETCDDS